LCFLSTKLIDDLLVLDCLVGLRGLYCLGFQQLFISRKLNWRG